MFVGRTPVLGSLGLAEGLLEGLAEVLGDAVGLGLLEGLLEGLGLGLGDALGLAVATGTTTTAGAEGIVWRTDAGSAARAPGPLVQSGKFSTESDTQAKFRSVRLWPRGQICELWTRTFGNGSSCA